MQVVDARDQGAWTVKLAETRTPGAFNGIGTGLPFGFEDLLDATVEAVGPDGTTLTWVDGCWLAARESPGRSSRCGTKVRTSGRSPGRTRAPWPRG